jgi:hypothetical protein
MEVNSQCHTPQYPLDKGLVGLQWWSGRYGEENNLVLPEIEPRPSSPLPVAIPTELSGLVDGHSILQISGDGMQEVPITCH